MKFKLRLYLILVSVLFTSVCFSQNDSSDSIPKIWSFEDCISYALANNISIKDAALNTSLAEVDKDKAKSSVLPNLFASGTQSFSNGKSIDPITSNYESDQINSTNLGLHSSMTLFQGGQIQNEIKKSKLLLKQNSFLERIAENDITISILQYYLQILYSKEDLAIAENNLLVSEQEMEQSKARLKAGEIALKDYNEVQSQAATNKYNVIVAKNTYEQNLITLKQLLEFSPLEDLEVKTIEQDVDFINFKLDKTEIYTNAINHLPELKASDLNIAVKQKELEIQKGSYLPTLSLTGSIGTGYTSINNKTFSDQMDLNLNQQIGLSISIPLFNRNQTKSAIKTARINIEKAELEKQKATKEIYKNIETAYQNALSAQEQVIASRVSTEAAKESYKLAQKKYELGELSATDLVISQNTLTNTQQNYLQAKYLNILYYQLLQFYQGNEIKL